MVKRKEENQTRRIVIVSNRLPCKISENNAHDCVFSRTDGGLISAFEALHSSGRSIWVGWDGLDDSQVESKTISRFNAFLKENNFFPVHLTPKQSRGYYEGFSNSTLWPLFHGFPQYTHFGQTTWESYVEVNRIFCDTILKVANPNDIFWIQDYHLMLLPDMLRKALPDATIGFFLHIPFPNYETFQSIPWRAEILRGLLGADLVGFHTYDYVRNFLDICCRILGTGNRSGSFLIEDRAVRVDVFPLGIDYDRFCSAGTTSVVKEQMKAFNYRETADGNREKTLLSVARLDYTKGIPSRLRAFNILLQRHPELIGRVTLLLVVVPSRENVVSYQNMKREIDCLVGGINGRYSIPNWSPISYYYRSLPFESLCAAYAASDVMLSTPLRDGMNLVCKEYLAVHNGQDGVLILSEMAGAARELNEAIIINPFDISMFADAMYDALTMPLAEQRRRSSFMCQRLKSYTSKKWTQEFLNSLEQVKDEQKTMDACLLNESARYQLIDAFRHAKKRAIILDYDGTLIPFSLNPETAKPDAFLMNILKDLSSEEDVSLAIISGRDQTTLQSWFGELSISLIAEHGALVFDRMHNRWSPQEPLDNTWKDWVKDLLTEKYVERTPGSFLEEKEYSLVWHYRACDRKLAERRISELKCDFKDLLDNLGLAFADGNKVIEIKSPNVNKGIAVHQWLQKTPCDFLLIAGDDQTDEDMFNVAPDEAWTIKVGRQCSQARFNLKNIEGMRALLRDLAD